MHSIDSLYLIVSVYVCVPSVLVSNCKRSVIFVAGFLLKLFLGRDLLPCIFDIYVNMLCYGKSTRLKCRISEILSS